MKQKLEVDHLEFCFRVIPYSFCAVLYSTLFQVFLLLDSSSRDKAHLFEGL